MAQPYLPPNTIGRRDVVLKRGDTAPPFSAILRDANGDPVDLTGASARLLMRFATTRKQKVAGACSIPNPPTGQVVYQWATPDTDRAGVFELEVEVTYGDFTVETFPRAGHQRVRIDEDVR